MKMLKQHSLILLISQYVIFFLTNAALANPTNLFDLPPRLLISILEHAQIPYTLYTTIDKKMRNRFIAYFFNYLPDTSDIIDSNHSSTLTLINSFKKESPHTSTILYPTLITLARAMAHDLATAWRDDLFFTVYTGCHYGWYAPEIDAWQKGIEQNISRNTSPLNLYAFFVELLQGITHIKQFHHAYCSQVLTNQDKHFSLIHNGSFLFTLSSTLVPSKLSHFNYTLQAQGAL